MTSVHYWASPLEANLCAHQEVALVGAGNSAGQATVYLASRAKKVWLLARGGSLEATMSRYLVDRIRGLSNVEVLTNAEVTGLEGSRRPTGGNPLALQRQRGAVRDPASVPVHRRRSQYRLAEELRPPSRRQGLHPARARMETDQARKTLETNIAGVFAIGDVRSGSIKRVAASVGEGAQVVAALHSLLADMAPTGACAQT